MTGPQVNEPKDKNAGTGLSGYWANWGNGSKHIDKYDLDAHSQWLNVRIAWETLK